MPSAIGRLNALSLLSKPMKFQASRWIQPKLASTGSRGIKTSYLAKLNSNFKLIIPAEARK